MDDHLTQITGIAIDHDKMANEEARRLALMYWFSGAENDDAVVQAVAEVMRDRIEQAMRNGSGTSPWRSVAECAISDYLNRVDFAVIARELLEEATENMEVKKRVSGDRLEKHIPDLRATLYTDPSGERSLLLFGMDHASEMEVPLDEGKMAAQDKAFAVSEACGYLSTGYANGALDVWVSNVRYRFWWEADNTLRSVEAHLSAGVHVVWTSEALSDA